MTSVLAPGGTALLLVKPQFEVGRSALDSRGVVADPHRAIRAVDQVVNAAAALGWRCAWRGPTRLAGERGNQEFFVKLVPAAVVGDGSVGGVG